MADGAPMQRRGNQRPSGTCFGGGFEVADIAHAAGRIDRASPGLLHHVAQAREALGTAAFAEAEGAGASQSYERAIAEVRGWLERLGN